jgi:Skp family chaperone for outer membrane proteins
MVVLCPEPGEDEGHENEESITVKKSMVLALSLLSLGVAAYFGSQVGGQTTAPARPAATAQTRIAMLNLRWVIKNYDKYKSFIEQMKNEEKTYLDQLQGKQKLIETKAKELDRVDKPLTEQEKEKLAIEVRNIQRDMEDIKLKARKEVTQKSNDEMVKVYKEVRDAAYRHAQSQGFDLVLHFEGPADKGEIDSPVLVTRNMNAGGCVPLYWNPALDISGHVLNALNIQYKNAGGH